MKLKILLPVSVFLLSLTCCQQNQKKSETTMKSLNDLFARYYDERMKYFPLEATTNGDNRYNDLLPVDISESYSDTLKHFFQKYLDELSATNKNSLNENDRTSYDI